MTRDKTPERPATGVRRTPTGWQSYVLVSGVQRSKRWPPRTALTVMRQWREEVKVRARLGASLPASGHSLREDVAKYLQLVRTMPTLRDRRDDLNLWLHALGPERVRQSITAQDIRAQLETWRSEGYAANTVNHRRTALMHLWSVLDGRSAPNPARDVPRYRDDSLDAPPRALSPTAADLLLEAMPRSLAWARLNLMRWTGWPPAQMARITPQDIRWDDAVYVRPRRKGAGASGLWLPILPQAWDALREYKRLGAWGKWRSSGRPDFRRAAERVRASIMLPLAIWQELEDVTPYQLRHTFATMVAAATSDDRAVKTLLQHSDIRTTHRYTQSTADPRAAAALAMVAANLSDSAGQLPAGRK